jgi:hypothetical protein
MPEAAERVLSRGDLAFGCVTIAERHLTKGTEHLNILRKQKLGAQWFISQAVYDADATIRLITDYATECKKQGVAPTKIILTFAPCGRPKTIAFIRWLGIKMSEEVEQRILAKATESKVAAVQESCAICCEALQTILNAVVGCGVPLGINVESVSGFKEEIDGCFELFRQLQQILLDSTVGPWGVRWYRVPLGSLVRSGSEQELARLEQMLESQRKDKSESTQATPPKKATIEKSSVTSTSSSPPQGLWLGLATGLAIGATLAKMSCALK